MKEYTLNAKNNQECIPVGCVPSSGGRGVCLGDVCRGVHSEELHTSHPMDRQTLVKTLPFRNYCCERLKKNPKQTKSFQKRLQNILWRIRSNTKQFYKEHARLFEPYHKICSNIDQTYPYLICNYDLYVFTCNCRDLHLEFI